MRIIAGKFKKTILYSVPGKTTRPTTDYLREVIFSVIYNCTDKRVLDLFAGSGALGLEALSRGAECSIFVEFSNKSINTIRKNINKLNLKNNTRIFKKRVSSYLNNCEKKFDLIFIDPPYDKDLVNPTLFSIIKNQILTENGKIIIEHSKNEIISNNLKFSIEYNKKSGNSIITILKPAY